jgi:Cu/Ag efflux protein CusF
LVTLAALAALAMSTALFAAAAAAAQPEAPPEAPPAPSPPAAQPASPPAAATDSAGRPWVEAEVRRVDAERQRVSLRHGPIPNLGMAPMTMVFQLRDPALLPRLRAGERIRFSADRVDGEYTVIEIAPTPTPKEQP